MKRVLFALLPAMLLAFPMNASAVDSVGVSLGCSEPTASFDTVTDLETATGLTNAVSSMALYPAGLACGLTQSAPALSIGSSKAFAVGGGQMPAPPQCADSSSFHFGFSAHATDALGDAKGSILIGNSMRATAQPSARAT